MGRINHVLLINLTLTYYEIFKKYIKPFLSYVSYKQKTYNEENYIT